MKTQEGRRWNKNQEKEDEDTKGKRWNKNQEKEDEDTGRKKVE